MAPTADPFRISRGLLLWRCLGDRDQPDLERLDRMSDPAEFVSAILPDAARTFAVCIALLPAEEAAASAVAYLYCRILDTYEDLERDPEARDRALAAFAARVDATAATLAPAPELEPRDALDARDRAHVLLVRHVDRVDEAFLRLSPGARALVSELVQDMARGMRRASAEFVAQGGVLADDDQLLAYCRAVLGGPVVFSFRLARLHARGAPDMSSEEREDALRVGELVQLANVTRDIEKDLARGVAYDPSLAPFLGSSGEAVDHAVAMTRARLLRLALRRGPSYLKLLEALDLPRWSAGRASAVLMLLFTERYWRACARRCGVRTWDGPDGTLALVARALAAGISPRSAVRQITRIEGAFGAVAAEV